jgi:hypothetical protein
MKLEGTLHGIPIYSTPNCPKDQVYMINPDNFYIDYPLRKDGKPDMRYSVNRLKRLLNNF